MTIFKLATDFKYTDLTFIEKEDVRRFAGYRGQQIEADSSWTEDVFGLSDDKLQKEKVDDFDARCYGATLIIKKKFQQALEDLLPGQIQCLPVSVREVDDEFIYVNLLNIVAAINLEGLDFKQTMEMLRSTDVRFRINGVKDQILFRDEKINNFYFCTDKFIDFAEANEIRGLKFDKMGEAR